MQCLVLVGTDVLWHLLPVAHALLEGPYRWVEGQFCSSLLAHLKLYLPKSRLFRGDYDA